ncbi:MAG: NYN domain-containing protein [Anaerolineae bacterium]|nr:NYN domain-containing protein [Anaerolineae bacterium]
MPILIDGHNLIGRMPTLSLADPDDERQLVALLLSYRARTGKAVTVVFDPGAGLAPPESRRRGGVEVLFAPHGGSADEVIARRVRRSRDPAGITVVTSDRELAGEAAQYGARVKSAEAFAAELDALAGERSKGHAPPLSAAELEAWLALFEGRNGTDALG